VSRTDTCPDCGGALERMTLQGTDAMGSLTIVDEGDDDGFLGGFRANEILEPVPYVCAECRRVLWSAEE
jgi:hypothetical protein